MSSPINPMPTSPTPTSQTASDADVERRLRAVLDELTVEEKTTLLVGASAWATAPIERIGLRPVVMSDGPVGVRGAGGAENPGAETSVMLPAPSALGATWDPELAARVGRLFAAEARRHDVDVVLAPQINLQRTPVAGRHFECYSEDPHLTAEIAVPLVRAAQEAGVGMCVKHYVANDSETDRTRYVARVDEQTLREVYLAPFERVAREAGAWSLMGAYSGADCLGVSAPMLEHRPLLTGVLKDEWGFDGLVVSDWVATQSIEASVTGGLDLQMPGPDGVWGDGLLDAVRDGRVAESDLDDKVLRLLRLAHRVGALAGDGAGSAAGDGPRVDGAEGSGVGAANAVGATGAASPAAASASEGDALARELAGRCVVVLKDDAGRIPLVEPAGAALRPDATVALIGPAATDPFLQGGGSSLVVPAHTTRLPDELRAGLDAAGLEGVRVVTATGARSRLNPPELDDARATDPVTGEPGYRVDLIAADGRVLETQTLAHWTGWLHDAPVAADRVRLRARIALPEPGTHELGVGTVGVHEVRVDGAVTATGDTRVNEDVVLASGHNHPIAALGAVIAGPDGGFAELDATCQVVHTVGYGHFVRAAIVHALPGPSAAELIDEAVRTAREADVAVVVVGTTEEVESEGYDRPNLDLPGNQDDLVRAVLAARPDAIVVVNAGAPVLLPWLDEAQTALWAWLGGQEAGLALADVLLGRTEPSGRLPWTLPARAEDVPVPNAIPAGGVVDYTEGVDVGYRGWERSAAVPAAPFGHGLGWTTWEYVDARVVDAGSGVAGSDARPADGVPETGARPVTDATPVTDASSPVTGADVWLEVRVTNTGPRTGREVVQVYCEPADSDGSGAGHPVVEATGSHAPADGLRRPVRWLGGFAVVSGEPGETVTARVRIPARAFEVWDSGAHGWVRPVGQHRLRVGRSVRDLRLEVTV